MKIKKIVIKIVVILSLTAILFAFMDYKKTIHDFEKPMFAQLNTSTAKKDFGSGKYYGIGYSIDIKGNFMPEDELEGVTHAKFYLFGIELKSVIRD